MLETLSVKAIAGGSSSAVISGGVIQAKSVWGLPVEEWTVYFGIGGIVIALLGLIVSSVIKFADLSDKKSHRRQMLEMAKNGIIEDRRKP